jgi:asparagine synthase (glutamine-hydrolysing)
MRMLMYSSKADFIGTEHHEVFFTVEQGIALLDKLIWHLKRMI